ncbi:hypothetical protein [Iningainema tapete]|uniref:Uncharacterized protein n=1 Tax=Iningainema tapete BLCC-T55 TaxID=2748662 RepID=A0A8J6XJM6_9CYAN|nr:hypothetical protein [Iningainema tapete]MBD2772026.1 hypothetical protein [Iningainema tapete BLCC-T55]
MNRFNHQLLEILEENPEFAEAKYSHYIRGNSEIAGSQFNLIMQQIGLGLPVEPFLKAYPQIANWVDKVKPFLNLPGSKQWNAELQYYYQSNIIYSQYDLVIYAENQVIGFDWTIQKPTKFEMLESRYQTQLRLFLLQQKTTLNYDAISLIYLFVNSDDFPIYQFTYSKARHTAFKERLERTLAPFTEQAGKETVSDKTLLEKHNENLQKLFRQEITGEEYLATIPEVEI